MPWNEIKALTRHRLAQHGLSGIASAGLLCRKAELLHPGLFVAVSVRSGVLHLRVQDVGLLGFKAVEGPLVAELNTYALANHLPPITRVRLTIVEGFDIVQLTV